MWLLTLIVVASGQYFEPRIPLDAGRGPVLTAACDLNGDGVDDAVVSDFSSSTISVFINAGVNGSRPVFVRQQLSEAVNGPFGVVCADLNRDGRLDLVWCNDGTVFNIDNKLVFVLNEGTTSAGQVQFSAPTELIVGDNPSDIGVGDFNEDGFDDLVVTVTDEASIELLFNAGNSTSGKVSFSQRRMAVGVNPYDTAVADFNNDGHLDICVTNNAGNTVSVLINDGPTNFERTFTETRLRGAIFPRSIWAADFSGDGLPDIAVGSGNDIIVFVNTATSQGVASFSDVLTKIEVGDGPAEMVAADFDRDGQMDIAVNTQYGNKVAILMHGDGAGVVFNKPVYYFTGRRPWGIASGDFNADERADLIVCDVEGNTASVLLGTSVVQPTAPPSQEQLSGGSVLGIIAGVVVGVMLLMFIGMYVFRRYVPAAPPVSAAQQHAQDQAETQEGWVEGNAELQEYPKVVQEPSAQSAGGTAAELDAAQYPDAGPVNYPPDEDFN